jgi:hypothetical protein
MARAHIILGLDYCDDSAKAESNGDHLSAANSYFKASEQYELSEKETTDENAQDAIRLLKEHCQSEANFQYAMHNHYKQQPKQEIEPLIDNLEVGQLRGEMYSLFIRPWETLWPLIETESDSNAHIRQAFFKTLNKCQKDLSVLIDIAQASNNNGPSSPKDPLGAKIVQLSSSLNAVQVTRLQNQIEQLKEENKQLKNGAQTKVPRTSPFKM